MRYLYLVLVVAFFSSCSGESNKQEAIKMPEGQLPTLTSDESARAGLTVNPEHGQPGHDCSLPVGAPFKPVASPVNTPANGLNPEHGMPGHDCSLPVGAPLKSAATQATPATPVGTAPAKSAQPSKGEVIQEANGG